MDLGKKSQTMKSVYILSLLLLHFYVHLDHLDTTWKKSDFTIFTVIYCDSLPRAEVFCFKKNHDTSPEKSFLPRQDSDDLGFSPPVGSPKKPTSESAVYDIQIRLPVSTSWMFDFPVC